MPTKPAPIKKAAKKAPAKKEEKAHAHEPAHDAAHHDTHKADHHDTHKADHHDTHDAAHHDTHKADHHDTHKADHHDTHDAAHKADHHDTHKGDHHDTHDAAHKADHHDTHKADHHDTHKADHHDTHKADHHDTHDAAHKADHHDTHEVAHEAGHDHEAGHEAGHAHEGAHEAGHEGAHEAGHEGGHEGDHAEAGHAEGAEHHADAAAPATNETPAPAAVAPADAAAAPAAGEAAPAADSEAPADGEAAEAPAPVEPKPPTPPPPPPKEPTSAPVDLFVEDKNNTSVSIIWSQPQVVGPSGLDGYTIEICKDGTEDWKAVNQELQKSCRYVIKNQTTDDRLKIRVVAVNAGGRSPPVTLPEAVLVKEVADRPKVRLPRFLRQRYVVQVGDKVNLTIPFTGKPKPVVSWLKNGQPLDTKRVHIRSTERDSILFIRTAERDDSGEYEMCVKVDDFDDKAALVLQIVELPGPPASVKIVDTWGFNAALEWTPPTDDGNADITGYTVQKADKKTGDWFTVVENYHRLNATVSDLIMGNIYKFRVFSENQCGISEEATISKEEAKILKTGIDYKPPEYHEHDFSEAPKFTTSLNNRCTTVGYSTKLLCSVRGCPKPKVQWMKNQMIIGDDPKFRQICVQGICSLEIRRPSNFDGGVYSCKAVNDHGEATVSCKLEVKQPVVPDAEKK